jgi:hypothetical protein
MQRTLRNADWLMASRRIWNQSLCRVQGHRARGILNSVERQCSTRIAMLVIYYTSAINRNLITSRVLIPAFLRKELSIGETRQAQKSLDARAV